MLRDASTSTPNGHSPNGHDPARRSGHGPERQDPAAKIAAWLESLGIEPVQARKDVPYWQAFFRLWNATEDDLARRLAGRGRARGTS